MPEGLISRSKGWRFVGDDLIHATPKEILPDSMRKTC